MRNVPKTVKEVPKGERGIREAPEGDRTTPGVKAGVAVICNSRDMSWCLQGRAVMFAGFRNAQWHWFASFMAAGGWRQNTSWSVQMTR